MLDRDKPLGQCKIDGHVFGQPPTWFNDFNAGPRARHAHNPTIARERGGWIYKDRPHGRSGDKLIRKAMRGKIGKR